MADETEVLTSSGTEFGGSLSASFGIFPPEKHLDPRERAASLVCVKGGSFLFRGRSSGNV